MIISILRSINMYIDSDIDNYIAKISFYVTISTNGELISTTISISAWVITSKNKQLIVIYKFYGCFQYFSRIISQLSAILNIFTYLSSQSPLTILLYNTQSSFVVPQIRKMFKVMDQSIKAFGFL